MSKELYKHMYAYRKKKGLTKKTKEQKEAHKLYMRKYRAKKKLKSISNKVLNRHEKAFKDLGKM